MRESLLGVWTSEKSINLLTIDVCEGTGKRLRAMWVCFSLGTEQLTANASSDSGWGWGWMSTNGRTMVPWASSVKGSQQ